MMWPGYGMGLALGWLWVVLILVGLALLIYVAIRVGTRQPRPPAETRPPADAARRILEERLARGEIDVDEFTERMRALSGG